MPVVLDRGEEGGIEEFVDEKFSGTTKEDAAEYIDRNIEEYRLASCDAHQLERGYF